jgi:hypothetical protein
MTKLLFLLLAIIPLLFVPSVFGSGPRYDYPKDRPEIEVTCYRDGYEQGFAGMYDSSKGSECYTEGRDWYNKMWSYACDIFGRSEEQCNDIRNNPVNVQETTKELGEENEQTCYNVGYQDGLNRPFDQQKNKGCDDYGSQYYHGFMTGCMAADNTREICERFTDV